MAPVAMPGGEGRWPDIASGVEAAPFFPHCPLEGMPRGSIRDSINRMP